MHCLLAIILIGSAAFRSEPPQKEQLILTMIPSRILDEAGAGGGSPTPPAPAQPTPPAPAQPTPPAAQPQPQPAVVRTPVEPQHQDVPILERFLPKTIARAIERDPTPEPDISEEPAAKPAHKQHEIHVDLTPASSVSHKRRKTSETVAATESTESETSTGTDSRRARAAIASALDRLAVGVQTSGAAATVVDMPGQGSGEAFAGYETVIYNAYYHAWTTPDSVANRQAATDVKIVVARDGTIISAEIANHSGERALDRSVERALRAVEKLPPFPAGAHDEQRTFLIRFNLDAKESSG